VIAVGKILSIEIVFRLGPTMKVYTNEIYDLRIDSIPVEDIDFSQEKKKHRICKTISFKIKECENRRIWSFEQKSTVNYFDWILSSGNISEIKINLQNYQKQIFSVPWQPNLMNGNKYQSGKILNNGDLSICIEKAD